MIIKKCVLPSLAWWVAVSTEVGALSAISGMTVPAQHGFDFTTSGLLVHYVLMLAITAGLAVLVFRKSANRPSAVMFAGLLVGVSLALDAAITAPLVVKSYAAYFGKPTVWLGYALAFGCAFLVARAVTQARSNESSVDQHA